jgi:hypothetical protein
MHQSADERIAALAAIGGLVLALLAFRFAGFLGVGLLGPLIGLAAFNYDLRKSDVGGGSPSPNLYARQMAVWEQMSQDEKFAYRAGLHALWRPLTVAKTVSVGMIVLGFAGYLLLG